MHWNFAIIGFPSLRCKGGSFPLFRFQCWHRLNWLSCLIAHNIHCCTRINHHIDVTGSDFYFSCWSGFHRLPHTKDIIFATFICTCSSRKLSFILRAFLSISLTFNDLFFDLQQFSKWPGFFYICDTIYLPLDNCLCEDNCHTPITPDVLWPFLLMSSWLRACSLKLISWSLPRFW